MYTHYYWRTSSDKYNRFHCRLSGDTYSVLPRPTQSVIFMMPLYQQDMTRKLRKIAISESFTCIPAEWNKRILLFLERVHDVIFVLLLQYIVYFWENSEGSCTNTFLLLHTLNKKIINVSNANKYFCSCHI